MIFPVLIQYFVHNESLDWRRSNNTRQTDFGPLLFQDPSEEAEEGPSQAESSSSQVPAQEEGE